MQDIKVRLITCGVLDTIGGKYEWIKPGNSFCIIKGNRPSEVKTSMLKDRCLIIVHFSHFLSCIYKSFRDHHHHTPHSLFVHKQAIKVLMRIVAKEALLPPHKEPAHHHVSLPTSTACARFCISCIRLRLMAEIICVQLKFNKSPGA